MANKLVIRRNKQQLAEELITFFTAHPDREYSLQNIAKALKLKTHPLKLLCADVLDDMVADDFVSHKRGGGYRLNQRGQEMEGTFVRKRNGRNSFIPDGEEKAILVMERNSLHALDGDRVKATLLARRRNHTPEAEITEIIKRAKDTFGGELTVDEHFAFLLTQDRTLPGDIFIPKANLKSGRTGDKAVVRIVDWPDDQRNPVGEVMDVLGHKGENDAEMHAILAEYNLPYKYPEDVERLADHISDRISEEEIARREDFRDVLTFTIDPHDAKDFDDALSVRPTDEEGVWEVGVHIADVTYYVKEGGKIDQEALRRATSVYLVDRTIPMLPERLCNYLCSLRPDEEKLTYSAIFRMNEAGDVLQWHPARTVIRSNRRFAYEEVQAILEQNGEASPEDLLQPGDHPQRVQPNADGSPVGEYAKELILLNRLAKALRAKRQGDGAISFDRPEIRFDVDEKGHPVSTYFKVAKDANKLIEEFMLLANRHVAELIGKHEKGQKPRTFVYRIHDVPDLEKLERLSGFVRRFGYDLRTTGSKDDINKGLNRLLADSKGKPEEDIIAEVTLRAMMKAKYSTHNVGHYGLMFRYYTHFTSPIRRYPDDMVHRLLTRYLDGGKSVNQNTTEELCEHCSEMEQLAATAERASIKYKQVEFMADRLGQDFDGKISGMNEFGVYVELDDNGCEGMIPLRDLGNDYYEFDEKNYQLVGRREHHRYSLGDRLRVRVAEANLDRRQLEFELVERLKKL